jgi:predicted permease
MTTPSPAPSWRRYLRFWGSDARGDVDDELRFHVDMRIDEYVARGMPIDEARRLAAQRFGDAARARDQCLSIDDQAARAAGRANFFATLRQDVVYATRVLRRQRAQTLLAVACLALGIGATTSMFTVTDALLLRPMPFPNGDRLATVSVARATERGSDLASYPDYLDWRARQHSFVDIAAFGSTSLSVATTQATLVDGLIVSASYFRVLGIVPERGRLFAEGEDTPSGAPVVIVSHSLAEQWFGDASRAVGRVVTVRGDRANAPERRTIVGVVPDQSPMPADMWVPIATNPNLTRGNRNLQVIGLLRPGVSFAAANRDIAGIESQLAKENSQNDADLTGVVRPLRDEYVASSKPALAAMFAATVLVLLVACANVAGIQLARAVAREREIAVRSAIGAARTRILRQLLTESVILSLAGGLAGVLVAQRAGEFAARAVIGNVSRWLAPSLDLRVLAFALAVAAVAGIVFGVAPAMRLTRVDPADALRGGTARVGASRPRLQQMFVVAQIALSLVLLVLATLSIESVRRLEDLPLGFDRSGVLTFRLVFQTPRYDSMSARARLVNDLADRLRALPGVRGAGAVSLTPLSCCSLTELKVEGHPLPPGQHFMVYDNSVSPGYFAAMGIGMLRGHDFTRDDTPSSMPVIIVNQTFADRFWPGGNAIGEHVQLGSNELTIVGVVNDVKQGGLLDAAEPQYYVPVSQYVKTRSAFAVRANSASLPALTAAIRSAVHELDPSLAVFGVRSMDEIVDRATAARRAFESLMVAFGIIAVALAAMGIFAVMSFVVAQRRREMGLRMALGAAPGSVRSLVLAQGGRLGLAGAAAGVAAAVVAAHALAHSLYGVSAGEPAAYIVAAGVAAVAVAVATLGPAHRAARVDPATTLRSD